MNWDDERPLLTETVNNWTYCSNLSINIGMLVHQDFQTDCTMCWSRSTMQRCLKHIHTQHVEFGLAITHWSRPTSHSTSGPISTGMGDLLLGRNHPSINSHQGWLSLLSSGVTVKRVSVFGSHNNNKWQGWYELLAAYTSRLELKPTG